MMAKKFKRVMSLLMVFVLCFGMLNLSVVAVEGFTPTYADSEVQIEGESVPVYHVHGGTSTVEDPLVANRAADAEVYASKTIYPTADENVFEIELMVETSEKITELKSEPDAAVSLVIDYSGSMKSPMNSGICLHCGESEENAEREETYNRHGREYTRTVKYHACVEGKSYEEDPTTKMDAAIAAAQDFVREFAAGATTGKRWISVTIFDKSATTLTGDENGSWVDVATADGLNTVLELIGDIEADYGTNVAHGLALGSATLDEETVADLQNKYVVILGDGRPSDNYSAPAGNYRAYSSYTDNDHVNAEKWARKIREDQNAQLFSVYVEENGNTGSSGYQWFNTFCAQTVLATNTTTLVQAFEQQLAFITFGIEAWSVTDPMGANIRFVDKISGQENYSVVGNTLTWNLINDLPEIYAADGSTVDATEMVEDEAYTFLYTFRYSVRLDNATEDFAEDTLYETNGNTYLQYYLLDEDGDPIDLNGNTTNTLLKLDFVVPAVRGYLGEFRFVKENADGEPLSGAQFALIHDGRACVVCGGEAVGTLTASSDENGLVTFSGIPSGHSYTLVETVAPEGYELSGDVYNVVVSYDEVAISLNGQTVEDGFTFVNLPLPVYGPLTIVKEFAGDEVEIPAELAFTVTGPDGYNVTIPYADFVDGSYTIESLVEGEYTVTETGAEVEGYRLISSDAPETAEIVDEFGTEVYFVNTYERIPETGTLTITKEFVDVDPDARPTSLVFDVAGPEGYEGETYVLLNNDNNWRYTIENVPAGSYTVTEYGAEVDGYELISTTYNGKIEGDTEVSEGENAVVDVVNTYGRIPTPGTLIITKNFSGVDALPETLTFEVKDSSGATVATVPYADFADGSYAVEGLNVGEYTVTETGADVEGYTLTAVSYVSGEVGELVSLTVDGGSIAFENTYEEIRKYGDLTITKEFSGVETLPETLTFEVKDSSGATVATVRYAAFVNGAYTVERLPVGEYTVTETGAGVEGYTLTVTGGSATVTENGGTAALVNTYEEIQKYGSLTITKSFSGIDALPAALTFEVRNSAGEPVATVPYADFADGAYTVEGLPVGEYTVTETGADAYGYTLTATAENDGLANVTENGGSVAFENIYTRNTATIPGSATITVEKVDENGELITGTATFGLFKGERRVATARTVQGVATFTFGNDGLEAGEYTLKEVSAPRGYLRTEETWAVEAAATSYVDQQAAAAMTVWNWTATVNGASSVKVVNVEDTADVVIDKTASAAGFTPGEIFTYTLKVTNVGTQDATEVTVVDNLPAEVYYWDSIESDEFAYDDVNKRVTWTAGALAVGESKEITFQVRMKQYLPTGTVVVNEAYVVWNEDPTTFHKDVENVTVTEYVPEPFVPPYIPPVEPVDPPVEIEEPEVPLGEEPGDELEEIEDDEVPLADVPKTGDPLLTLLAVMGASGAGLTGLVIRGKREEEDE